MRRSPEQLTVLLQSPQFRRQMDQFHAALVTGQLDLRHFGLDAEGFSVADFLEAVQRAQEKQQSGQGDEPMGEPS